MEKETIRIIESIRNKHRKAKQRCCFKDCDQEAIKFSHVLQKNGILRNISQNNHLHQFHISSFFDIEKRGRFFMKKIGINEAFTFPGFCKYHDNKIFSPIENFEINFEERITNVLFAYRAICQEIYRKEVSKNIYEELLTLKLDIKYFLIFTNQLNNEIYGIKNLSYFKSILESEIDGDTTKYIFNFLEFEKVDVCISAPINIFDKKNKNSYEDFVNYKNYVTSIINIFPYRNKSYLLIAQHEDYLCNWTQELFDLFKTKDYNSQLKLLSDLLCSRFEFWCISPNLYKSIDRQKFNQLFLIWEQNILNHNKINKINFNLFEKFKV